MKKPKGQREGRTLHVTYLITRRLTLPREGRTATGKRSSEGRGGCERPDGLEKKKEAVFVTVLGSATPEGKVDCKSMA